MVAGFAAGMVVTGRLHRQHIVGQYRRRPSRPRPRNRRPSTPRPRRYRRLASAPDFTKIAGQAVKGVANISSLQVVRRPNSPFENDPFFQYFFGDQDFSGSRDRRSMSLGSGVIISSDGYIVTNNHVVGENMREITVALSDNREVKGRVIGTDPATDIALLKVDLTGLPSLPLADSSKLLVGEWVLAIGSPFQWRPDSDGRHHQRDRPVERRLLSTRTSSRRMRRSIRATRAAPSSTRAASWLVSTPHLQPERRLPGHRVRGAEQSCPASSAICASSDRCGAAPSAAS